MPARSSACCLSYDRGAYRFRGAREEHEHEQRQDGQDGHQAGQGVGLLVAALRVPARLPKLRPEHGTPVQQLHEHSCCRPAPAGQHCTNTLDATALEARHAGVDKLNKVLPSQPGHGAHVRCEQGSSPSPREAGPSKPAPKECIEDIVGVKFLAAAGPGEARSLVTISVIGGPLVTVAEARKGLGHHCSHSAACQTAPTRRCTAQHWAARCRQAAGKLARV